MTTRHSLTDKDTEARTAICSIDGPVKIRRAGTGWTCAVRANAQKRKWNARHPDRDRLSKSEHRLTARDADLRVGQCRKCGAVEIVPNGRGWMCGPRAKELGRVNHQDAPRGCCQDCWVLERERVWLTAEGCPRCIAGSDLHMELRTKALDDLDVKRFTQQHGDLEEFFMHVAGWVDPYEVPEFESAVVGWKTIA